MHRTQQHHTQGVDNMPRIPGFESTKLPSGESGGAPMSPGIASESGQALVGFGQQVQRTANIWDEIAEKEALAHDSIEAVKLEGALKQKQLELSQAFEGRTDYQNFEPEMQKNLEDLRSQLTPKKASQRLSLAFERSFQVSENSLMTNAKVKKWAAMETEGKVAFGNILKQSFEDWKNATPEQRPIIAQAIRMKGYELAKNKAINILWVEETLDKYEDKAHQYTVDAKDVEADKLIKVDPVAARLSFDDSAKWSDLPQKVLQDKIEKADSAIKIKENELESKAKKAKEEAKSEEDRIISKEYVKGNYAKAYSMVLSSQLMEGGEMRSISNMIKEKSKIGENVPPELVASEIVKVNDMIRRGEDPEKIKRHVIYTPNFKKEDKEQYLNKLETKYSQEEQDGMREGYGLIEKSIFKNTGLMAVQTQKERDNVASAQKSLDDWISFNRKQGKYLTREEIKVKAAALGISGRLSMAQKIDVKEAETRKEFEGIKNLGEAKKKIAIIPEAERVQIEKDLKSVNQLPTAANILSAYEQKQRYEQQKQKTNYGLRKDGTNKGNGWLGPLKMKDGSGKVATELSIDVDIDGKKVYMPLLTPALTKDEVDHLLQGKKPTDMMIKKAINFGISRIKEGKSPFKD